MSLDVQAEDAELGSGANWIMLVFLRWQTASHASSLKHAFLLVKTSQPVSAEPNATNEG